MRNWTEYRRDLDALHFTEEQKQALATQVAAAAKGAAAPVRHRRPMRRIAVVAAAAVLVLAVGTAGATGALKSMSDAFSGVFRNAAETKVIENIGHPIGASDTDNGLTITADAILGDKYSVCVVYTLTADDPTLWEGLESKSDAGYLPLMFHQDDLDLGMRGGSHGGAYFIDQVPGDNEIQFVETQTFDKALNPGGTAKVIFRDLVAPGSDDTTTRTLAKGKWVLKFDLNFQDSSQTLPGGKSFQQDGLTFTVDELTISPLSFTVNYTVDQEIQWSDSESGKRNPADAAQEARFFENIPVRLTKTDGSVLDLSNSGGSIRPENGTTICTKSGQFDEILDLKDVASITVGDIVFPLG